jgi:enoyl-CoA hydratase
MEDDVLVETRGNVLVMTLNRPRARNAINGDVATALAGALDWLEESNELRVGVLTGAGGVFSAGMDLKAFLAGELPSIPGRGLGGLTEQPPSKPMIAAVEGWALAGGFELVLACDLVVAAEGARFGTPEVKRSLVPTGGGALELPHRVPRAIALELLMTGEPISAGRAAEAGLVNRVVPDGAALERAVELAEAIARNGPLALRAVKEIARSSADWTVATKWERQREISDPIFASEDAREGSAAFVEKRDPVWRGR